jgi:methionyl-tRNA formyltransferase
MKNTISVVFFGTHEFATTILQGLIESPLYSVELVITQPDKPFGRKKIMTPPPVKVLAEKNNIPVDQPDTLKNYILENKESNIGIVAQYGKIIPASVLKQFTLGLINTHTSLLPKYRGASPIQSALMNSETETGVTIMKMDEGMDTGPILSQEKTQIEPNETYLELDKRLANIASALLNDTVAKYVSGEIQPQKQNDNGATLCKLLSRDDGRIDWQKMDATEVFNHYRGLTPWPGIWSTLEGKRIKLNKIEKIEKTLEPGLLASDNDSLYIGAKEGSIKVLQLQLEGKPEMDANVFINGYKHLFGKTLQ